MVRTSTRPSQCCCRLTIRGRGEISVRLKSRYFLALQDSDAPLPRFQERCSVHGCNEGGEHCDSSEELKGHPGGAADTGCRLIFLRPMSISLSMLQRVLMSLTQHVGVRWGYDNVQRMLIPPCDKGAPQECAQLEGGACGTFV